MTVSKCHAAMSLGPRPVTHNEVAKMDSLTPKRHVQRSLQKARMMLGAEVRLVTVVICHYLNPLAKHLHVAPKVN